MSRRLDVILAVKALVAAALPDAEVLGLDNQAAKPARVKPLGRAIVSQGDPGEAEVDLSPLLYHYAHAIPVGLETRDMVGTSPAAALDEMLGAIGARIVADRTLGGLCDWIEAQMPSPDDYTTQGASIVGGCDLTIVASYATSDPLN